MKKYFISTSVDLSTYPYLANTGEVLDPKQHSRESNPVSGSDSNADAAQIADIIAQALGSIKFYVLESDISKAQDNVRAVVSESVF